MFIITTTASDNKQKKEWEGDWLEDVCGGSEWDNESNNGHAS